MDYKRYNGKHYYKIMKNKQNSLHAEALFTVYKAVPEVQSDREIQTTLYNNSFISYKM